MRSTFQGLSVGLETEAELHSNRPTGGETAISQRGGEVPLTSAHPQQGRFRITARRRLHKIFQCAQKPRLRLDLRLAAAARTTNTAFQPLTLAPLLRKPTPDRAARDARRLRNRRYAAPSHRKRFIRCKQTPRTLVQKRRKPVKACLDSVDVDHPDLPKLIGPPNQIRTDASRRFGTARYAAPHSSTDPSPNADL